MSGGERGTTHLTKVSFAFGVFRVNLEHRTLTRDGQTLALTPKEFDTLLTLVQAEGRLVEKEDLLAQVWPDCHVGDGSLARNISVLRRILGPDVITTVPRHGYRLNTPVGIVPPTTVSPSEVAIPPRPPASFAGIGPACASAEPELEARPVQTQAAVAPRPPAEQAVPGGWFTGSSGCSCVVSLYF